MNYGEQILEYGKLFMEIVPFDTKANLNLMLIGSAPLNINHTGFIGWWCFDRLKSEKKNANVRELLKDKTINEKLEKLYYEHQNKVIKPLMVDIIKLCKVNLYQSQISKQLGLNYLEIANKGNKDYVAYELLARLEDQKIIESYKSGVKKCFKVLNDKLYMIPTFVPPNDHLSLGMRQTLQILSTMNIHKIELEYPGPILNKRNSRYDIAVYKKGNKSGIPDGFIEFDGEQHHQVSKWHGEGKKGLENFLTDHLHDKQKDVYAKGFTTLPVLRLSKNHDLESRITKWLDIKN